MKEIRYIDSKSEVLIIYSNFKEFFESILDALSKERIFAYRSGELLEVRCSEERGEVIFCEPIANEEYNETLQTVDKDSFSLFLQQDLPHFTLKTVSDEELIKFLFKR
jgi:hypothetical protein